MTPSRRVRDFADGQGFFKLPFVSRFRLIFGHSMPIVSPSAASATPSPTLVDRFGRPNDLSTIDNCLIIATVVYRYPIVIVRFDRPCARCRTGLGAQQTYFPSTNMQ